MRPLVETATPLDPAADPARIRAPQAPGARRWRFARATGALVLREMETTYGRSPGGYAWAVLEPVGVIALMSVMFSFVLRAPGLGTNFPLFFATGHLSFTLFLTLATLLAQSVQYSRALLAYPAVTIVDALASRLALNALTQLLVMGIVIGGICAWYDLAPILDWGAIVLALAMALALAVGVGTVNCFLFARLPVWRQVWGIVSRPLFLVSGVLYVPEVVPAQWRGWLMWNPAIHVTSEMRRGFYPTYDAVHVRPLYPFLVALVLAIFGLLFLLRHHKDLVER